MDFTCYYNHRDRYKSKLCQQQVDRVRRKFNELHARQGIPVNHYYNTPSCHNVENETPFYERSATTAVELLLGESKMILIT